MGGNTTQLLIVIVINLVISFVIPNVAWQAHVGGLAIGAAIAAIYVRTRRASSVLIQAGLVAAVAAVLIVIAVVKVQL